MKNKSNSKNILVIDDDFAICSSLKLLLRKAGYLVDTVNYPKDALAYLAKQTPNLILLDMNFSIDTSGKQGLKMLEEIKQMYATVPVILITGWGTLQLAVKGMKLGASDFLTKPWDNKELLGSIKTILDLQGDDQVEELNEDAFELIIGEDPILKKVLAQAKRIGQTNAPVLILGESGTGKELLAEAIHNASPRQSKSFVKVNLGGISSSLFESEMFGHKKGAFTDAYNDRKGRFEMADEGTIFLDEIGDLDLSSQVKLLRVLQEKTFESLGDSKTKKVDFRIVSATNKDLSQAVTEGNFREDLLYRINLITLTLPPLRQRPGDIPLLVKHFVNQLGELYQTEPLSIADEALEWLSKQALPGNIRELKNWVERTVLLATSDTLTKKDFQLNKLSSGGENTNELPNVGSVTLHDMEKQMVLKALDFHGHNIQQAAKSLGITRSSLYRRMQKFGLTNEA